MTKEEMKKAVCAAIDTSRDDLIREILSVEAEPELGWKETKTAAKMAAYMRKMGLDPETGLAINGVKGEIHGAKDGPAVAILAELDAVGTPDSPKADPLTGAAHTCGHFLQMGAMLAALTGIAKAGVMKELAGTAVFFAVPAEEYIEIDYRKKLRKEGKIHFLGGKSELVYRGCFDDVDMAMMMHSQGNAPEKSVYIGQSSNGFVGKTVRYIGKQAHAANAPFDGINALNAACLGIMGINSLRETFKDEDHVRVHPIITKGGDFVNSVPADVRMELYVRAATMDAIDRTHHRVDAALKAGGDAIGAKVEIDTLPGMLPLSCDENLNKLFVDNILEEAPGTEIKNAGHFSASTDMGDISHLMPAIHPYIGGADGGLHTKDFVVTDYEAAFLSPGKAFAMTIIDLLYDDAKLGKKVLAEHKNILTKEEYLAKMDSYFSGSEE
ncbi:amidohydrolase [uncultured Dialister sp.]|uniref:amidohydrolase n=1 Tax=uncultured Dialister sp. TaxID=278064 RepID=UPI0025F3E1C5|nr:amidohydrolase [uncultured Dialister sp.]